MAVREKTLTRTVCSVKHLPTGSTHPVSPHNDHVECGSLAAAFEESTQPPNSTTRHPSSPPARHGSRLTLHKLTSSNTSHTTPKFYSTDPPNASPPETHAAPADKPPTPSPLHTASTPDKAPGSAPADQPYPHPPAAPMSASLLSSNAQMASYSEIPPVAPKARHKTTHRPPGDPPSQIPRSNSPSPPRKPPP